MSPDHGKTNNPGESAGGSPPPGPLHKDGFPPSSSPESDSRVRRDPSPVYENLDLSKISLGEKGSGSRFSSAGGLVLELNELTLPADLQGAIFDFDGTVAQTFRAHREPLKKAVEETIGVELTHEEWSSAYSAARNGSLSELHTCERALLFAAESKGVQTKATGADIMKRRVSIFQSAEDLFGVEPIDGAIRILRELHTKGVRLGICTTSMEGMVLPVIRKFGIADIFSEYTFGSDVPPDRQKPDPLPYEVAARRMGIEPHKLFVFEDSTPGCLSAARAGLPVAMRMDSTYSLGCRDELLNHFQREVPKGAVFFVSSWSKVYCS